MVTDPVIDRELLPKLLKQFPNLHISKDALITLWRKNSAQMNKMEKKFTTMGSDPRIKKEVS